MAIQTKDRIVKLHFDLAQELLQSKMKEIRKRTETILLKWHQEDNHTLIIHLDRFLD